MDNLCLRHKWTLGPTYTASMFIGEQQQNVGRPVMLFSTKRGQERTTEVTFNLQGSSGVFHIIVLILSLSQLLTFEKHLLSFNGTCFPPMWKTGIE